MKVGIAMKIEIELDVDDLEKTAHKIIDSLPLKGNIDYQEYYKIYERDSKTWNEITKKLKKNLLSESSEVLSDKNYSKAKGIIEEMEKQHTEFDELDQSDFINISDDEYKDHYFMRWTEPLIANLLLFAMKTNIDMNEGEVSQRLATNVLPLLKGYVIESRARECFEGIVKKIRVLHVKVIRRRCLKNSLIKNIFKSKELSLRDAINKYPSLISKEGVCEFLKQYTGDEMDELLTMNFTDIIELLRRKNAAPRFRDGIYKSKEVLNILEKRLKNKCKRSISNTDLTQHLFDKKLLDNTEKEGRDIVTRIINDLRSVCGCHITENEYELDDSVRYDRSVLDR